MTVCVRLELLNGLAGRVTNYGNRDRSEEAGHPSLVLAVLDNLVSDNRQSCPIVADPPRFGCRCEVYPGRPQVTLPFSRMATKKTRRCFARRVFILLHLRQP